MIVIVNTTLSNEQNPILMPHNKEIITQGKQIPRIYASRSQTRSTYAHCMCQNKVAEYYYRYPQQK